MRFVNSVYFILTVKIANPPKALPLGGFAQRVETFSTRWETAKKVGIFFVLAFVGVRGYARVRERKKQASTRLSR